MEGINPPLKPLGLRSSFLIFGSTAVVLFLQTHYTIPWLNKITGMEIIFFWFLVAVLGVFFPLIITALIILKLEGYSLNRINWVTRLRFKAITKKDLLLSIWGLILIMALSAAVMSLIEWVYGEFDSTPPFMAFEPLNSGRYWLLAVWFPYWIFNILGEELLWRGVMLPRQEIAFGKKAWVIHALGWGLVHIAFGWQLLITLLPILFIQSYIVQKTKNSWTGVIIHAGINGPSFIAIALGVLK